MKRARLTLPNDLAYLPMAMTFVRENAAMVGFDDPAIKDIEVAAEEAVSNVIQHAFAPHENAEFSVICERIPLGMKTIIKDKGQPFDPAAAPEYDVDHPEEALSGSGLGLFLMRRFMDDISFHILGREGKEVHLIKYLHGEPAQAPPAEDVDAARRETGIELPLVPGSVPFQVRLALASEAIEISKCAYDAYEYSYGHEHIYYPDRLKELIETGVIVSAVAVIDDEAKSIMAHNALIFDHPGAISAEIGMAFTKRQFQNQGCARATGMFLLQEAEKRGLRSVFLDCTTTHIYSQKAAVDAGARECCILLGIDPEAQSWKHFSSQSQRVSSVITHLRVPSTSPGKAGHEGVVHPPQQHREMIEKVYANLGWMPSIPAEKDPPPELPETLSVIKVCAGKAYQQTAIIEINAYGADIVQQIGRAVKRLCLDKLEVVYLLLDLSDPLTATVTSHLEALGFFFAGIIPRANGADRLELQYLNNVLIDYERIQLYSDFAGELLSYIQARDPTRNTLQ
jgi:anti-sigma regulatory factor (Ser/Thr protein kinase)